MCKCKKKPIKTGVVCFKRVSSEDFVKAYMTVYTKHGNQHDLAKLLGQAVTTIQVRVSKLRRIGVKLPKMKRKDTEATLDVCALNTLVRKMTPKM